MDDKSSSLKLKNDLFFYTNNEQQKDQRQLIVKENKDRSLTGLPTYAPSLTIGRNHYIRTINTEEFINRMGKDKQVIERQCG